MENFLQIDLWVYPFIRDLLKSRWYVNLYFNIDCKEIFLFHDIWCSIKDKLKSMIKRKCIQTYQSPISNFEYFGKKWTVSFVSLKLKVGQFRWKLAELAVLFSRQILNGSQDIFFSLIHTIFFIYLVKYETIETYTPAFFMVIIFSIGIVNNLIQNWLYDQKNWQAIDKCK